MGFKCGESTFILSPDYLESGGDLGPVKMWSGTPPRGQAVHRLYRVGGAATMEEVER